MGHGIVASLSSIGVAALLALSPTTASDARAAQHHPSIAAVRASPTATVPPPPTPAGSATPAATPHLRTDPTASTRSSIAPADVTATLLPSADRIAPGRSLSLTAEVKLVSGTVPELGFTLTLPTGVTWQRPDPSNLESHYCTSAPGGRSITCMGYLPDGFASDPLDLAVHRDVPDGTELRFTVSAVIGSAANTDPAHGTASTDVLVKPGSDWGLKWIAPTKPVPPGTAVRTDLVLTNYGPDAETHTAYMDLDAFPFDKARSISIPPGCLADSGEYTCQTAKPLPAGSSITYTFSWKFTPSAAGRTLRIPTRFIDQVGLDPDPANDSAVLQIVIAQAAAQPTPSPTATEPARSADTSTNGALAATGSDSTLLAAAAAGTVLLGVLLLCATRLPGNGRRHRNDQDAHRTRP